MRKNIHTKVFFGLLIFIYVLFVVFQFIGNEVIAKNLDDYILTIITLSYLFFVKKRTLFFTLFLVLYTVSDLMAIAVGYIPKKIDYYLGNTLYILSYTLLLLEISKSLSFSYVFKYFKIYLIVLIILSVYMVFVLQTIVCQGFIGCVECFLELIYNIVILILLSTSLLNFFYLDTKKALYLFIGVLCIVFSEVIWVAYLYVSEKSLLDVISKTLLLLAFYFFYKQSRFLNEEKEEVKLA